MNVERCAHRRIDMSRGLPSPEQIALSRPLLNLPGELPFASSDGQDWLNYGGLQGVAEVRELLAPILLGLPACQCAMGGNSSLALMHQTLAQAWIKGFPGALPWAQAPRIRFLCIEPGYDRHFAICEYFGIEMVPVPMCADGPDMDIVERHVATDASVRGMWCVPRHANPTGTIYSAATIERLGSMPSAAKDFRIICDNAYVVHDFPQDEARTQADALTLHAAACRAGHEDRVLAFASTSKMTIPGAGIALFGASPRMLEWWLQGQRARTVGPDKVNQVRHLLFFRDAANLHAHMRRQGALVQLRVRCVEQIFQRYLDDMEGVSWSSPSGGYFLCLRLPVGTARDVAHRAATHGIQLTKPGATHCHGLDPEDRYLRIAPSQLSLDDTVVAATVVARTVEAVCGKGDAR